MRIALIIERLDPESGGAERYAFDLSARLASAGHDVSVICASTANPPPGVSVVPVPVPPLPRAVSSILFARASGAAARSCGFDIVHALMKSFGMNVFHPHTGSHLASVENAISTSNSPFMRSMRRLLKAMSLKQKAFRAIEAEQYSMPPPGLFVAVSRMVMRDMTRLHGVNPSRIRIIPNGVDCRRFAPAQEVERREIRAGFGLGDGDFAILFAAHNFRLKGLGTLIEAAGLLRARAGKNVILLVAGAGRAGPFLEHAERTLPGRVRFLGGIRDMPRFYRAGDLFVLPTFYDPCSLTVLEAMACGIPAVTSSRNGASELFGEEGSGWILGDPSDAEGLAGIMEPFLDSAYAESVSARVREIALGSDWEGNFRSILGVYGEVAR